VQKNLMSAFLQVCPPPRCSSAPVPLVPLLRFFFWRRFFNMGIHGSVVREMHPVESLLILGANLSCVFLPV